MNLRFNILFASGLQSATNADSGGWVLIAPYGDHPFRGPDGAFVQVFNAEAAAGLVSWFHGFGKKLARVLGFNSVPVFLGHPDFAPEVWPQREQLGTVADLRATERGLEARFAWNARGEALRGEGVHIYPSAAWECEAEAPGSNRIHPMLLWSVGMWQKPNIQGVESVAAINALSESPETETETEPSTKKPSLMNKIKELLIRLGFLADPAADEATTDAAVDALALAYDAMVAQVAESETEARAAEETVTTTNARAVEHEATITTLNAERDTMRGLIVQITLDSAIAHGRLTVAEREATQTALNAAPDLMVAAREVLAKPVKVPAGERLDLGGARSQFATVKEAQTAINAATNALCDKEGLSYHAAFLKAKEDPALKGAFEVIARA